MNLEAVPSKIIGVAEDNAGLLAFGLGTYARAQEGWTGIGAGENSWTALEKYFTFSQADGWTPVSELMHFIGQPIGGNAATNNIIDNIKWKFWEAPHLNTQLFKVSAIAYIAGKYFGLFGGKWLEIAKKVAIGAGVSALILPSSGAGTPNTGNVRPPNPTAGSNYTGGKIIGY